MEPSLPELLTLLWEHQGGKEKLLEDGLSSCQGLWQLPGHWLQDRRSHISGISQGPQFPRLYVLHVPVPWKDHLEGCKVLMLCPNSDQEYFR